MKNTTFTYIAGGAVALIGLAIVAAFAVGFHHPAQPVPAQRSDLIHSAPPAGYAIQTNGKGQWRWFRTQNGDRDSWAPMDSRQAAVESAWIWYNFDHAEQQTWRLESPPADPNAELIEQFSHIGFKAERAR